MFKKLKIFNMFNINSSKVAENQPSPEKNVGRLIKFDNLKGLAIIFVVCFHSLNSFFHVPFYRIFGHLIAFFSLPLFFFVSGYFSKVDENTQIKAFKGIFIPYIVFCTLAAIFLYIFESKLPGIPYLVPATGLWFLISLFLMKTFLPLFVKIKNVFWILIACALLIGLIPIEIKFLGLLKTIYYLPFFMIGYYFKNSNDYLKSKSKKIKDILLKLKNIILTNKKLIFIFLILFLVILAFIFSDFPNSFFSFEKGYAQLKIGTIKGMLLRLLTIFSSIIVVILLTYLMPNKQTFLTKVGLNSLAVYVLHFYFTKVLQEFFLKTDLGSHLFNNPILAILYVVIVTTVVVFITSRNVVSAYMNKFLGFFVKILVKPMK